MPTTAQLRTRLISKLKELFQLDQPDLDFGFYRIMHAKAEQVERFIDNDLLKIVDEAFAGSDKEKTESELDAAKRKLIDAMGEDVFNPDGTIKEDAAKYLAGKAYTEAVAKAGSQVASLSDEGQVYDHLFRFFERYYDNGDFVSRRYYTRETDGRAAPFAIPYNGEEVKLHWANADQYYIKTAEYFNNYTFDLTQAAEFRAMNDLERAGSGVPDTPVKVHFKIVEASEGEHGNVKAKDDDKRFFIIHRDEPIAFNENGELVVHFEYRADPEKGSKQEGSWRDFRNGEAVEVILKALNHRLTQMDTDEQGGEESSAAESSDETIRVHPCAPVVKTYLQLFQSPAPTEKDKKRPLLAKYLNQYTARNTMDYFIHKNLGGFLRRELDFYIKNEVMRLDDLDQADAPAVESYLSKLKVLRKIAHKLIDFLAQLEDFQKKLWLKKKFVVETNYCITLDRVPEELYAEIAANEAQREEWVKLFAIDEIGKEEGSHEGTKARSLDLFEEAVVAYSEPLTVEFLKANDKLVLDTEFFDAGFKARLLAAIEDFDAQCDGLLVHSDNYQAINLIREAKKEQVKCIYIDPPYNTSSSAIPYKNNYKHSSWGTMMGDRLWSLRHCLRSDGAIFVSIDKTEQTMLEHVMDAVFGEENHIEELIWAMNTTNSQLPNYSTNHEYVEVYAKDRVAVERQSDMFREPKPGYEEMMALVARLNPGYPAVAEIEQEIKELFEQHKIEYRDSVEAAGLEWDDEKGNDPWKGLYNYSRAEYRDLDGRLIKEEAARSEKAVIWIWREDNTAMPATKQAASTRDPAHPNWRFYKPEHPLTGKPAPHPKSGWKFPYALDDGSPDRRTFQSLDADGRIAWGSDEKKVPQIKRMLHEVETNIGKSVFTDYSDGEKQTSAMFGESGLFLAPKHSSFVSRFIQQADKGHVEVIDCFGGSGSTGHAVIDLVRADRIPRKFIQVEVNNYFETLLKPRLLKAIYASSWNSGKPRSKDGISHCFKYIRLESYEDTLNNLSFDEDAKRTEALSRSPTLKEDYMLRYLLDVETRGSQSLLNINAFADPTAYQLTVKKPGSEMQETRYVDLIETFNYLIGLRVTHYAAPQSFTASFKREPDPELPEDQHTKLVVDGAIKPIKDSREDAKARSSEDAISSNLRAFAPSPETPTWWFRKVEGWIPKNPSVPDHETREKNPQNMERILIVWRKLTGDLEQDNLMLDVWFRKHGISTQDYEYDTIYVNGSNNLPNLKQDDEHWKVRLIEEEFMKRMWEGEQ